MTLDPFERDVNAAAVHVLQLLDNVQEQLAAIRKTVEQLQRQQEGDGHAPDA